MSDLLYPRLKPVVIAEYNDYLSIKVQSQPIILYFSITPDLIYLKINGNKIDDLSRQEFEFENVVSVEFKTVEKVSFIVSSLL